MTYIKLLLKKNTLRVVPNQKSRYSTDFTLETECCPFLSPLASSSLFP